MIRSASNRVPSILKGDEANLVPSDHFCTEVSSDLMIPPKWRENVINCRKCKRALVCFLSSYFTEKVKHRLKHAQIEAQTTIRNCWRAWRKQAVMQGSNLQTDETLICNAEESDTRIWLHVLHSAGTNKLVLSPDTDVYHIGLPIVAGTDLSPFSALEHRLLNLQALITHHCFWEWSRSGRGRKHGHSTDNADAVHQRFCFIFFHWFGKGYLPWNAFWVFTVHHIQLNRWA